MRIQVFSQYFAPEVTAATARLLPLAEQLAARGHEVEVICEVPNHPEGVIREEFRGHATRTIVAGGFTTRHVWVRTSPVKTQRSRLEFYGSFAAMATWAGLRGPRPDVILVSSPPLPAAAAAMAVAKLRRVPWVMDVRDPWPEAAVALGELTNPRVVSALERLERRLYRSAAAVITVTEPFRSGIRAKVDDPGKVEVIPNGTTDAWIEAGGVEEDRGELGMDPDRFILTYAGNVGLAQGLEAAIEAAADLDDGFQLQVVGSGPRLAEVKRMAAALPEGRVVFRGLVPPELARRYLRASDVSLVPLAARPELAKFVPSKLFDCAAVGRAMIVAAAGEPARIADEAEAAICIAPDDGPELVAAVRRLREAPELRDRLGANGRELARAHRREDGIGAFERVLSSVARRG